MTRQAKLVAARQLVIVVNSSLLVMRSPVEEMPKHAAGLGLARCNRLLAAMFAMNDHGIRDVASLPLRPLYEIWVMSLWLLYEPEKAFETLVGQHVKQVTKLSREGLERALREAEAWTGSTAEIKWKQTSDRVGKVLEATGDLGAKKTMEDMYELVYRGESLMEVHGGIGTVSGHLEQRGRVLKIRLERKGSGRAAGVIIVAALLVAILASHVFEAFELPTDEVDALGRKLGRVRRR